MERALTSDVILVLGKMMHRAAACYCSVKFNSISQSPSEVCRGVMRQMQPCGAVICMDTIKGALDTWVRD